MEILVLLVITIVVLVLVKIVFGYSEDAFVDAIRTILMQSNARSAIFFGVLWVL